MTALHLSYAIRNAQVRTWPYHHVVVDNVFPGDLYREMREHLPQLEAYRKLGDTGRVPKGAYPQRHVLYLGNPEHMQMLDTDLCGFWTGVGEWLLSREVTGAFVDLFRPVLSERFRGHRGNVKLRSEVCLMRDLSGYALGPHTDSPRKVISVLFYLPPGCDNLKAGTSIYVPRDRAFVCPGGPHHPRSEFDHVLAVPFRPNTMFAFAKTDRSFHGVEPVPEWAPHRDLMLYDVFQEAA